MPADSSSYSELNGKRAFVTGGAQGIGRARLRTRSREAG
jgi:NAD(P)-dependent dehydrogenase (short-subunit alcohol dehydrogenase family)